MVPLALLPVSPWWLRGLLRFQGFCSNRLDFLRKRELRQGALEKALKSEGFKMVEDAQKRNVARRTARASRKRGGPQESLKEFLKGPKGGRPKSRECPLGAWG